ncbi:chaperone NapD [Tropicimonas sediminicola]|uniref:Chaperone NapD n=1 Tax=Tropicimonas sediminicola TaxID=1031541 RepID=A0A239F406_9RHOB|nr:chaperone NapD [Tropicimonas sediminicola]SNS51646.1 periplasmic nitrate reductase chaperone NapD [Tropicimonas sediminicola]
MNICGCLVHAAPGRGEATRAAIEAMNGTEVHAVTEDERLVVVVEDTGAKRASELIMEMHQIPGVISVTLTYHHFEDPEGGDSRPQPVATPCTL